MVDEGQTVAGWKEWVSLPDLGVDWIKAKLDTGARSSSLHAYNIEVFERDGQPWTRFEIHPWQRSDNDAVPIELPLVDRRIIRSSTGHEEERLVVATTIRVAGHDVWSELTLANRDAMGLRMLIGRMTLRDRVLVNSVKPYLHGRPPRHVRIRNRERATE